MWHRARVFCFVLTPRLFVPCIEENDNVAKPDSLDWTSASLTGAKKTMLPTSSDAGLLDDSYTSDGTTTTTNTSDAGSDLVVGRGKVVRRRTKDGVEVGRAWSRSTSIDESVRTPDSLLNSELMDDSFFDGELDLIGT